MTLISVVIPVKDERANLRPLVTRIRAALVEQPAWEIVFVDDGSIDGTAQELGQLAAEEGRVKVVRLRRNFGQSAAMQAGFDHAVGDVVVTMDGDLQNDPADIPAMLAKLREGYDVVLGQRQNRQDNSDAEVHLGNDEGQEKGRRTDRDEQRRRIESRPAD